MQRLTLVIVVIALLALLIPSSLLWYQAHYSMRTARSVDIGAPSSAQHVLIAAQGSLIHTWEYSKPQADAKAFVDRLHGYNRIIVVGTSGSGKASIPGYGRHQRGLSCE
jgi:hypothetical protein